MSDGNDHPPAFLFYARDFLSSTAVALMSPEARGGYITLLCHAWLGDEPGLLPDDDSILSSLSGLGDRWPACSVAIRRAFRATSREGCKVLLQRRMVAERQAQVEHRTGARIGGERAAANMTPEQRVERARNAANARWGAERMLSDANIASASASASAVAESTPERPRARKRALSPVLTITPEQREAAARKYGLDRADVDSFAERIEAEAAVGKYVSAPGALHTFCRNEIRYRNQRGNGKVPDDGRDTIPWLNGPLAKKATP